MKTAVNNHIGSLNWGYRVALRDKNVTYVNAYAEFIEPHKIKVTITLRYRNLQEYERFDSSHRRREGLMSKLTNGLFSSKYMVFIQPCFHTLTPILNSFKMVSSQLG